MKLRIKIGESEVDGSIITITVHSWSFGKTPPWKAATIVAELNVRVTPLLKTIQNEVDVNILSVEHKKDDWAIIITDKLDPNQVTQKLKLCHASSDIYYLDDRSASGVSATAKETCTALFEVWNIQQKDKNE